ncbi:connector enhancer of kinase suppressor of ras 2-like isoform X1 [Asterias rubens]|uniref:connector enhancer of kinase suppressor of ras 2-like isoform X1 n=1 Tax=Asterias rubens TaxID=7604 RepID=UPI001455DB00|nr:connector enhancer of kinase suppressor of ras 2-like isoform X1 [Asterias rubens]
MSSLHITSWTPQEIGNWIKGLDNALEQYIPNFIEHQVNGDRLLKLTIEELDTLNITKMGHKELMLEAVDLLSVVHYGHPSENLQSVALKLNTNASNLANLLQQITQSGSHAGDRLYSPPSTILQRVSETISAAKTLISWLDRPPFSNNSEKYFQEFSKEILQYALDMTQAVQQQSNLTAAVPEIMAIAREFTAITDNLNRQSTDPLVIQPTTVEEVRIRKKQIEEELGLFIKTSTIDGIHYITGTKEQSAANLSRKVGSGDELLRVNGQTVVSWEHRKVIEALRADLMGVLLTLRKRPCNLGSPGQIIRPGNSQYPPLFGTPQLRRNDSFTNMRSTVVNGDFLMPASPCDLMATKARSNSDPEPPSVDTHETQSDPESLLQEAERIKRQRRGTMGEALQRKGSKGTVTSEGRPRSLPINTEELEAEMELIKASGISPRPSFSPIAGSPPTASTQTTPSPHGDKTINQYDTTSSNSSCLTRKVTISEERESIPVNPSTSVSKVDPDNQKPTHNNSSLDVEDCPVPEGSKQHSEQNQRTEEEPGQEGIHSETVIEPSSENSQAKNTNNNVAALEEAGQPEGATSSSEVTTFETEDYVVVDVPPPSPKTVTFLEMRKQSSASSLSSIPSPTVGVKLRPKKKKAKYKVTRGVSCIDLGPGECQGWLQKKTTTKFRTTWVEMWFVLREFVLYYYKNKKDDKAKGLLCLPGYQILEAPEIKKEHAFKATHKGASTLYFSAKHAEDRKKWIDKLRLASIVFKEEKNMRQSIIFQSKDSLDLVDMMQSVEGYHSESDDEDKDKKSDQSPPWSPSSSDRSGNTSSEAGSPQRSPQKYKSPASPKIEPGTSSPKIFQKRATKRDPFSSAHASNSPKGSPKIMQRVLGALRRHSRGSLSIDLSELEALEKNPKRRNSTPYDVSLSPTQDAKSARVSISEPATPGPSDSATPGPSDSATPGPSDSAIPGPSSSAIPGPSNSATPLRGDDPLLDSYKTIMDTYGCVVGFERTAVRTSKRYTNKDKSSLRRIHTVLDKDPKKNKAALQRRALQRTLKAKKTELDQIEDILSKASLTSEGIQEWKRDHEHLLETVLHGPKPDSPSDSGSDIDGDQDTKDHTDDSKINGIVTSTQETVDIKKKDSEEMASENEVVENNSDVQSDDQGLQSETSTEEKESTTVSDKVAEAKNTDDGLLEAGDGHERNGVEPSSEVETSTTDTVVNSGMVRTSLVLDENFRPCTGSAPTETSF